MTELQRNTRATREGDEDVEPASFRRMAGNDLPDAVRRALQRTNPTPLARPIATGEARGESWKMLVAVGFGVLLTLLVVALVR